MEWKLEGQALKRADSIHHNSIVVDTCLTTNFTQPTPIIDGEDALDRVIRIGGITAAHQSVIGSENRNFRHALQELNTQHRLASQKHNKIIIVTKSSDIEEAKDKGKIGLIMGFQGCDVLEDDWTNTLPVLYHMGTRVMSLTYNERNLFGYGCAEPKDDGLTACGAQVVRAMNGLGIIIDLSHVGMNTVLDAIELSEDPVIFTHSNVKAITPHVRNLTDEVIKAVAVKGGLIGITAWEPLCARPGKVGTLSDFLDHLDYVVNLIGVDHVGIGSDRNENSKVMPIKPDHEVRYSYMYDMPADVKKPPNVIEGWYDAQDIINVTRGLVARGYSEGDIKKILGGNFMRVARQVWDKP